MARLLNYKSYVLSQFARPFLNSWSIFLTRFQWDTAGQERFKTITSSYYRGSDGIFVVYDITNPVSFNNVRVWLKEIDRYMGQDSEFRVLLVGNKADQVTARAVEASEAQVFPSEFQFNSYSFQELARDLGCQFFETSAKDNSNVEKIFEALSQDLKKAKITERVKGSPDRVVNLGTSRPVDDGSCPC